MTFPHSPITLLAESSEEVQLKNTGKAEWEAQLTLPVWSEYTFDYKAFDLTQHSLETLRTAALHRETIAPVVELCVYTAEQDSLPNSAGKHSAALQYFLIHQADIQTKMLPELWRMVIECYQDSYNDIVAPGADHSATWEAAEEIANNPSSQDLESLKLMLSIQRIVLYPESKAGNAQLGLQFECAWDIEHGLEILLEQGGIVDIDAIGSVDTRDY